MPVANLHRPHAEGVTVFIDDSPGSITKRYRNPIQVRVIEVPQPRILDCEFQPDDVLPALDPHLLASCCQNCLSIVALRFGNDFDTAFSAPVVLDVNGV